MRDSSESTAAALHLPSQPSELRAWLLAGSIGLAGLAVLLAVLTGAIGRTAAAAPPAVPIATPTPIPGPAAAASALAGARSSPVVLGAGAARSRNVIVARPSRAQQR